MSDTRRIRSPNYPSLSLPEAIARIGPVYERERQHPMSRDVVLKGLGYKSANGAALGTLSAVAKYGLLDKAGDTYKVSGRALAILHPSDQEEKAEALRQAAFAPALFAELAEQFPGGQVSDDNLRSCLMRKGFSSGSLAGVISAFRETMQMVSLGEEKTPVIAALPAPQSAPAAQGRTLPLMHTVVATNVQPTPAAPAWVVSTDGRVLTVSAQLDNAKAVDKLILVLQANKLLLPEPDEPTKQQANGDGDTAH
jgi:hypothetical protein